MPTQVKKSAMVVVINSLLIYDYVGGWEGVNPDPDKVRTLSIYMFTGTVFTGGIPVDLQQERRETQAHGTERRDERQRLAGGGCKRRPGGRRFAPGEEMRSGLNQRASTMTGC